MKFFKSKIHLKNKKAGMSLIEVVVAIGISVVTLTTAVTFSESLSRRAQLNFIEVSVSQLQTVVTEQLRLVESELKKDAKEFQETSDAETRVFQFVEGAKDPWANFCNQSEQKLSISLPDFTSDKNVTLNGAIGSPEPVSSDGNKEYTFTELNDKERFGGVGTIPIAIGINKTLPNVDSTDEFQKVISLKYVIRYEVFGKTYYTNPTEVRMLGYLTCKA